MYVYPGAHIKTCPNRKVAASASQQVKWFSLLFCFTFLMYQLKKKVYFIIFFFFLNLVCKKISVLIRLWENFTCIWENVWCDHSNCLNNIKCGQNIINRWTAFTSTPFSTKRSGKDLSFLSFINLEFVWKALQGGNRNLCLSYKNLPKSKGSSFSLTVSELFVFFFSLLCCFTVLAGWCCFSRL